MRSASSLRRCSRKGGELGIAVEVDSAERTRPGGERYGASPIQGLWSWC
jgi:hypothetical protein